MVRRAGIDRASIPSAAALIVALLAACASDDPQRPVPSEPNGTPKVYFSPGRFCVPGATGADTLFLLNQGSADLVWTPVGAPAWIHGLASEVRVPAGESATLPWTWSDPPAAPFADTLVIATNVPGREMLHVLLENRAAQPPPTAPLSPLLAFPPDSARFTVGDTILAVWQEVDGCAPVEYRLQVSRNAAFTQIVCCQEFAPLAGAELIVEPGDEGRAWWRVVPRWVNGITGEAGEVRTWLVE